MFFRRADHSLHGSRRQVEIEEVPSDIFFENMSFKIAGTTLVADDMFDGVRLQVVLTKP